MERPKILPHKEHKRLTERGSGSALNVSAVIATHPIFQDDPKRMTEDEYVDFLVAQGMGRAQAKIFAAPHYRTLEN